MKPEHIGEASLLALLDGVSREEDARATRAHLATCPTCAGTLARMEALRARVAEVPVSSTGTNAFTAQVMDALDVKDRLASRAHPGVRLALFGAPALAAAAVLFVVTRGSDELVARGGDAQTRLGLARLDAAKHLEPVDEGARLERTAELTLQASLVGVAAQDAGAPFIVVARDAAGVVTWLWPAWSDAAAKPACPTLPVASEREPVARSPPGPLVSWSSVAPGALDVELWVVRGPCDIVTLDQALERDGRLPENAGALRDARHVQVR